MRYFFAPFFFCLALALVFGAAGKVRAASGQGTDEPRSWIQVSPGARPAYVGIQGGTARVSLSLSPDGSIIAHTGTSGNDFTKILHEAPPAAGTAPDTHTSAKASAARQASLQALNESALLPVGFDSPPDLSPFIPAPPEVKSASTRPFRPLKLGSYKRLLRAPGKV